MFMFATIYILTPPLLFSPAQNVFSRLQWNHDEPLRHGVITQYYWPILLNKINIQKNEIKIVYLHNVQSKIVCLCTYLK